VHRDRSLANARADDRASESVSIRDVVSGDDCARANTSTVGRAKQHASTDAATRNLPAADAVTAARDECGVLHERRGLLHARAGRVSELRCCKSATGAAV